MNNKIKYVKSSGNIFEDMGFKDAKERLAKAELALKINRIIDARKLTRQHQMDILKKLTNLEHEAADFGFKWETADQILDQIRSEIKEIEVHLKDGDKLKLQEEIGDLLHAVFSLCVFCKLDPHVTLTQSVNKFEERFKIIKQLTKAQKLENLNGLTFQELMSFWEQAKKHIKDPPA